MNASTKKNDEFYRLDIYMEEIKIERERKESIWSQLWKLMFSTASVEFFCDRVEFSKRDITGRKKKMI